MAVPQAREEEEHVRIERRNAGRLQRGMRTPESAFRLPILKALPEIGGPAHIQDILNKVEQSTKGTLKGVDYETPPLAPDSPRWRNTASWERNTMLKEGLLKPNPPHGVWEITEEGRKMLMNSGRNIRQ